MAVSANGDWPLRSPRANQKALQRKQATFGVVSSRNTLLVDMFFGPTVRAGTGAITTGDVTVDGAGKVWVKGPAAITTGDVSIAAAGTVSAGGGSRTGTVTLTTSDVSPAAEGNNISPPGAFPVTQDHRLPAKVQPIPRVAAVHRGTMAGRVAWWNKARR